ncbi:MAG: porin family protein [Bacteroidales bacterium]|nr:PorT family protein [Bacteroidales bacterium]MDD4604240.1 porin family protein [Bacteroidales bacterium]
MVYKRFPLLLLFFTFGFLCSQQTQGQRILGAISAGVNLTQVDGDDFFGYHKFGLNVGPMIIIPFGKNNNWSVSMELLYSQKGSYHKGSSDSTISYTYRLVQDYAEVPVLIHFTDKKLISGGVGFSYGRLINYKETSNSFYDTLFQYQTPLSNNDFSVIADLQIRIWSKLWANVRYQYSMVSNRTVVVDNPLVYPRQPETRYQYNNVISVRLTWVFNQPKIIKKVKQESEN